MRNPSEQAGKNFFGVDVNNPKPKDGKRMVKIGLVLGTISEAVAGLGLASSKPIIAIVPGVLGLINYGAATVNYRSYRKLQKLHKN